MTTITYNTVFSSPTPRNRTRAARSPHFWDDVLGSLLMALFILPLLAVIGINLALGCTHRQAEQCFLIDATWK